MASLVNKLILLCLIISTASILEAGVLHLTHSVPAEVKVDCYLYTSNNSCRTQIKKLLCKDSITLLSYIFDDLLVSNDKENTQLCSQGIYWEVCSKNDTGYIFFGNVECLLVCTTELKNSWKTYSDSIKNYQDSLKLVSKLADSIRFVRQDSINRIFKFPGVLIYETSFLREKPSASSKSIIRLIKGDVVYFQCNTNEWSNVKFKPSITDSFLDGWIPKEAFKVDHTTSETFSTDEKKRRDFVRLKYSSLGKFKADVLNGIIRLGMPKELVLIIYGTPENINRTVGSWGVHEQWVYGSEYFYFENGILTSWQD